jgi:hypothetical protein
MPSTNPANQISQQTVTMIASKTGCASAFCSPTVATKTIRMNSPAKGDHKANFAVLWANGFRDAPDGGAGASNELSPGGGVVSTDII